MMVPLKMYHDDIYEILDENNAKIVAVFYDYTDAAEYLEWRNTKLPQPLKEKHPQGSSKRQGEEQTSTDQGIRDNSNQDPSVEEHSPIPLKQERKPQR